MVHIEFSVGELSVGAGHVLWIRGADDPVIQPIKVSWEKLQVSSGMMQLGLIDVSVQRWVAMGVM